jgi:colanic acid biosynthesis protein WcaH
MKNNLQVHHKGYLEGDVFKTVIANTPLVSVDLIVTHKGRVLLGKRVNRPAKGYWFTLGGRVLKNEHIKDAIGRIVEWELGLALTVTPKFIGVFEHLYDDSIFDAVSTHYVNLAYEVELTDLPDLPTEQHSDYRWFDVDTLMQSEEVHPYVKDYFSTKKGTVPQTK